jgi:hypothetical protein
LITKNLELRAQNYVISLRARIGLEVTRFADYFLYHRIEDGARVRQFARVEYPNVSILIGIL